MPFFLEDVRLFFAGGFFLWGAGDVRSDLGRHGLTGEAPSEGGGCAKGCGQPVNGCAKVVDKMFRNVRILKSRV